MSCALEMLENQDQKVEFVNCFMENYIKHREEELEIGEHCAEGLRLDKNSVLDCYNSELGTIIQLKAEQATARIRPKFVPTILFDGQFDQQLQDDSITNFKEVVCKLQSKIPGEACKS
ncbi:unnamed protein product [Phaedon cochleariae]|uniref:Uncharacterized protein n=1 Tax=Phaedon cochleariae TaxID=80249 RepID=A0A9P0DRV6_PHACE|nr:unnamed protein product [Phaedon cochleariae]